jgi:DUF4097 and DUF4098 domain-containing protein YvlB
MNHSRQVLFTRALSLAVCALLVQFAAVSAFASSDDQREEFHQTYPLQADGRIELENINGAVHITAWDRNEVKVDAVKTASSKEKLDDARIEVDASPAHVSIRTKYPDHNLTFTSHSQNNPASVEYTLTVPRGASLDEISLVNGSLDITGVSGKVKSSCVNGNTVTTNLSGAAHLSGVNGRVKASFELIQHSIKMESVNGRVEIVLPSDTNAEIEAETISGSITNEVGLLSAGHIVGHNLRGQLGGGGPRIKLSTVNGSIEIKRASDGRTPTPVKDMNRHGDSNDKDDKDDDDDDRD